MYTLETILYCGKTAVSLISDFLVLALTDFPHHLQDRKQTKTSIAIQISDRKQY